MAVAGVIMAVAGVRPLKCPSAFTVQCSTKSLGPRLHWSHEDLATRHKSHPIKLTLVVRLRQETTLSVKQIAELLHLGKPKSARTNLHKFMNKSHTEMAQLDWISNEQ